VGVHAQEETQARALEQVIVVARRVQENVQDVPLAITALSGEELERLGVAQVSDLVQRAPSIQYSPATGRRDASSFGIRGQKADDVLLTSDQAVAVILGDVPVNWAYGVGISGAFDISAVEVAKGPQGTLFGKNSTGGAIIITPSEPIEEVEGMVKVGVGNYNLRQLEGMYNTPITDTLSVRIAATATKQDGIHENAGVGDDFSSTDNWAGRLSLKWQPTDELSSLFVIEGLWSSGTATPLKPIAANSALLVGGLYAPAFAAAQNDDFFEGRSDYRNGGFNDTKSWGVLNTTTYDVSPEITIKNIIGVRRLDYKGVTDLDGVTIDMVGTPPSFLPPGVQLGLANIQFDSPQFTDAKSITEEIQIIGSHDIADWIAGLYYGYTDGKDGSTSQQFNGLGNRQITGPAGGVTNQTIAVFAQSTWHLTDDLNLTTGLRFTKDDREVVYISRQIPNPPFQGNNCLLSIDVVDPATGVVTAQAPLGCELQRNKSFSEPTWNVSLDYKLTENQLIYGAVRRGYRAGGFPGRGQSGATTEAFDPEIVDDFEIGHKLDTVIGNMPLRINTALFYQDYQDIQRNITLSESGVLLNAVRNAASGTVKGGEIEFTFLPLDGLELSGFFSYVDASYDEWDDLTNTGAPLDRSPNTFANVPETSGSLTARYTLPLPSNVGDIAVSANVYWQDKTSLYVDNAVDSTGNECVGAEQGSYKIYNARVDWGSFLGNDGLSLAAWGKNLANEEYYTSGLCLYNTAGISMGYPGDPRTFGLSATFKF
jgi:iron complex outermembrane receptor protein